MGVNRPNKTTHYIIMASRYNISVMRIWFGFTGDAEPMPESPGMTQQLGQSISEMRNIGKRGIGSRFRNRFRSRRSGNSGGGYRVRFRRRARN